MEELSKSQKARTAIATFKTLSDSFILRGSYSPSGKTGKKLEDALRNFNPEIYGSMGDPRIVELNGLEYVIDRLPRGIEKCNKIILTAQEELNNTTFEEVHALRRRRVSYIVSDNEMCFVVTRGSTEIYDLLTHLTFLNIEAQKIHTQVCTPGGGTTQEWKELKKIVDSEDAIEEADLDQAIWNLSIILGRTYKETRKSYWNLEENRKENFNNGLFRIIYSLGQRVINETTANNDLLTIYFTPSLQEILGHHKYASIWADDIKKKLVDEGLHDRPVHIVSANLHSFLNLIYGKDALENNGLEPSSDLYEMVEQIRQSDIDVAGFATGSGFIPQHDLSGSNIEAQIFDSSKLKENAFHSELSIDWEYIQKFKPVILVMDYAFGAQAYEVMDELLSPCVIDNCEISLSIKSISIMGKAGILPGKKGDIMLATAHVMEGTPHNYILENDLREKDFDENVNVYSGPMVTVLGTSLQNRDVLERFHSSSWRAIGLEMEGGHYQRAINAAIIQGHIPQNMKTRYAYYASDNPLVSGETLASGPMGVDGVVPTYMISKIIIQKIFNSPDE